MFNKANKGGHKRKFSVQLSSDAAMFLNVTRQLALFSLVSARGRFKYYQHYVKDEMANEDVASFESFSEEPEDEIDGRFPRYFELVFFLLPFPPSIHPSAVSSLPPFLPSLLPTYCVMECRIFQ